MEKLLPYFNEELATLRRDCMELAARYPRMADKLGMTEDACGDPGVERLIQASALLSARVAKKLDDDYPRFTEALLQTTYPHYLCTFPSCSIVQVEHDAGQSRQARLLARGTELQARSVNGVRCRFRTTSDLTLAPVTITFASYSSVAVAPTGHRIDPAFDAALQLRISSLVPLNELGLKQLTLFIDGDPSLCAALRDTLFLRAGPAFAQAEDADPWYRLSSFPIQAAGFEEHDALLPWPARSHPAYRLISEYFAFPDKFNFIHMDLAAALAALPSVGTELTLHLAVRGMARDAVAGRVLETLRACHLRTHCVAVINLFARSAAPVALHQRTPDYPLVIDVARPAACELYTVDAARLLSGTGQDQRVTELRPFYGPFHGQGSVSHTHGGYWITHRDEMTAECQPGHEIRIAIVGDDMQPVLPDAQTLSVDVICSNRDLPSALPYGCHDGDLKADDLLDRSPIRFLRKPTPSRRFPTDQRAHWRLIAHLALSQRALSDIGLVELRKMLNLYDLPHSPVTQRQIAGMVALSCRNVHEWVRTEERAALMAGVEIMLTVDESAYVGGGLHVFVQVLDRFFALYGQINVFTRLVVLSAASRQEIVACRPRSAMTLLA